MALILECAAELILVKDFREVGSKVSNREFTNGSVQYEFYGIWFQKRIAWFQFAPADSIYLVIFYSVRNLDTQSTVRSIKELIVRGSDGKEYRPDQRATKQYDLKFCSRYTDFEKPFNQIKELPPASSSSFGWTNLYAVYTLPLSEKNHDPSISVR